MATYSIYHLLWDSEQQDYQYKIDSEIDATDVFFHGTWAVFYDDGELVAAWPAERLHHIERGEG